MRKLLLKKLMTATASFMMIAGSAFAGDGITLGEPSHAGSGCPIGTVAATLSPDAKSLSILFDNYVLEAGGYTRKRFDRKNCTIAIPVHVPNGFAVSVVAVDYRGFNLLPRGASSMFSTEYFFAGQRGPRYRKTFRGPLDAEYYLNNDLIVTSNVWSKCGADVNMRINTSMMLRTNSKRQEAISTVDSTDVNAGVIYHFQYKSCTGGNDYDDGGWDDW